MRACPCSPCRAAPPAHPTPVTCTMTGTSPLLSQRSVSRYADMPGTAASGWTVAAAAAACATTTCLLLLPLVACWAARGAAAAAAATAWCLAAAAGAGRGSDRPPPQRPAGESGWRPPPAVVCWCWCCDRRAIVCCLGFVCCLGLLNGAESDLRPALPHWSEGADSGMLCRSESLLNLNLTFPLTLATQKTLHAPAEPPVRLRQLSRFAATAAAPRSHLRFNCCCLQTSRHGAAPPITQHCTAPCTAAQLQPSRRRRPALRANCVPSSGADKQRPQACAH
jgi:hypothetical protein